MTMCRFPTLVRDAYFDRIDLFVPSILDHYDHRFDPVKMEGVCELWQPPAEYVHTATSEWCQRWIRESGFRIALVPEFLKYFGKVFRFDPKEGIQRIVCLDQIVVPSGVLETPGISVRGSTFLVTVELNLPGKRHLGYTDWPEDDRRCLRSDDRVLVVRQRR